MRISNRTSSVEQSEPLWVAIDKIQYTLGWSELDLCDRMRVTPKNLLKMKSGGVSPRMNILGSLADSLSISMENLVLNRIDYSALKQHANRDFDYVPERYRVGAFSRKRTSIGILDFVEKKLGWRTKKHLLNHLQLFEPAFSNPDDTINLLFPRDVCNFLMNTGYSDSIYGEMGAHSVKSIRHTPLGERLAQLDGPKEVHERVFSGIVGESFDRNCNYRILKLSLETCLLEAGLNGDLCDALQTKRVGSRETCLVRAGVLSSLPGYLGVPLSRVTEVTCIHRGDSTCRYLADFSESNASFQLRKKVRSIFH